MLRPLLLAILGAVLLCVFFGVSQQPVLAGAGGGMQNQIPKQPQMDAPPAVPSLTASQLQTDSVHSLQAEAFVPADSAPPSRTPYRSAAFFRDPIHASTILRI